MASSHAILPPREPPASNGTQSKAWPGSPASLTLSAPTTEHHAVRDYLGVRHEEHGWAEFLDGLLVLHDGECHHMTAPSDAALYPRPVARAQREAGWRGRPGPWGLTAPRPPLPSATSPSGSWGVSVSISSAV